MALFEIIRISTTRYPPGYFLKDLAGEDIDGLFYEEELSRVRKDLNDDYFEVGKILKSRRKGRLKECFISWKGYPEKLNSWVKATNLKHIR